MNTARRAFRTLLERRIAALKVALRLIEKEEGDIK